MKLLLVICAIICTIITARSNVIKITSAEYSDDIMKFAGPGQLKLKLKAYWNNEWNSFVDKIVAKIVKNTTQNETLPDTDITVQHSGKISVTKGVFSGFSTLYRSGNVQNLLNDTRYFIPCSFKKIQFTGYYVSKLDNKTVNGNFVGTVVNPSYYVYAIYSGPENRFSIYLGSRDKGNITVKVDNSNLEPAYESKIQTYLSEYSTSAKNKTLQILLNESVTEAKEIEKEIDNNRKHSTTAKYIL